MLEERLGEDSQLLEIADNRARGRAECVPDGAQLLLQQRLEGAEYAAIQRQLPQRTVSFGVGQSYA